MTSAHARAISATLLSTILLLISTTLGCGNTTDISVADSPSVQSPLSADTDLPFDSRVQLMKATWPKHFLPDAVIMLADSVEKPTVFGEPNPPEGFAGPDPHGRLGLGIYLPRNYTSFFRGDDISVFQWIFHEAFHLHNRRHRDYDTFIIAAFPTGEEPLVKWIARDPYHKTFAREEAFINLVTFADMPATEQQSRALRNFYEFIGAKPFSESECRRIMQSVDHK